MENTVIDNFLYKNVRLEGGGDTLSMSLTDQGQAKVHIQFSILTVVSLSSAQLVEAIGLPTFKDKDRRSVFHV